jgi:hypothetical protein
MSYWIYKPLCNINKKCNHDNIIDNVSPDMSNFDNLNIYENFKQKYIIKNVTVDDIDDLHIFLKNNYNFYYSIDILKWIIFNPFTNIKFNLLLYDQDMIIGSVLSIKKKLYINNTYEDVVSIVLLCIHHKYRHNKLACYLLDILIKKIKQNNINIGIFNTTHYLNDIKYIKNSFLFKRSAIKSRIKIHPCTLIESDFDNIDNIYFYLHKDEIDYWFNNNIIKNFKYENNILSFIPILYNENVVYLLFYKNIKNINTYNKFLLNILSNYDIYVYDNNKLNYKNFYLINTNYYYFYNYHVDNVCENNFII